MHNSSLYGSTVARRVQHNTGEPLGTDSIHRSLPDNLRPFDHGNMRVTRRGNYRTVSHCGKAISPSPGARRTGGYFPIGLSSSPPPIVSACQVANLILASIDHPNGNLAS